MGFAKMGQEVDPKPQVSTAGPGDQRGRVIWQEPSVTRSRKCWIRAQAAMARDNL
jgi:hypothetical protein